VKKFLYCIIYFYVIIYLIKQIDLYINYKEIFLFSGILPIKIYKDLSSPDKFRSELHRVGGVYGLVNVYEPKKIKQYIGSSKDLYDRLMDHLKGRDSNIRLQRSIAKYGLKSFNFVVYYFHKDTNVILTDIETEVIKSFEFKSLYNFKKEANSMLGYKHTIKAIKKMKLRFIDKTKHPMFGKKQTKFALEKISKPGKLNPMYGKNHSINTKLKISLSMSKTFLGLYDNKNNLVKTFINQVKLAKYLNLSKSTISRYFKSGKLLLNKYFIRKINKK
jgi:group I intron endonuclease